MVPDEWLELGLKISYTILHLQKPPVRVWGPVLDHGSPFFFFIFNSLCDFILNSVRKKNNDYVYFTKAITKLYMMIFVVFCYVHDLPSHTCRLSSGL